ncbi:MAG: hypothetical protein ACKVQC_05815 [Elusimicrobiota bacterium]
MSMNGPFTDDTSTAHSHTDESTQTHSNKQTSVLKSGIISESDRIQFELDTLRNKYEGDRDKWVTYERKIKEWRNHVLMIIEKLKQQIQWKERENNRLKEEIKERDHRILRLLQNKQPTKTGFINKIFR